MKIKRTVTKRIAAALSAFLLTLCSVPFTHTIYADEDIVDPAADQSIGDNASDPSDAGNAHSAFTKPSVEVDSDALYKKSTVLDDFKTTESWIGGEGVKEVEVSSDTLGEKSLLATASDDNVRILSISRGFTDHDENGDENGGEGVSTAGYEELSYSLQFGGSGSLYSLETKIGTPDAEHSYTCTVSPEAKQDVFIDISLLGETRITSLTISIKSVGQNESVSFLSLSSMVLGDVSHAEVARRFSALYVYGGEITDDGIKVKKDGDHAEVRAEAILPAGVESSGKTAMIRITIKDVGFAKITLMTSSAPAWRRDQYEEKTSLTATSETKTYVFCFDSTKKIAAWQFSFDSLSTQTGDHFMIEDVTIDFGGSAEPPLEDTQLGKITKCAYAEDGSITVEGEISHETVGEHIDDKIGLFIIPSWKSVATALKDDPALTSDSSTAFSFKLTNERFPSISGCRFAVALVKDKSRTLVAEPVWVAAPKYYSADSLSETIVTSDSVASTFESGAGSVIIDLDVSKLIRSTGEQDTKLVTWGRSVFYLSQDMLNTFVKETSFYKAAGVKVYFRIVCSTDRFSSAPGSTGAYYALDVSSEANCNLLSAVVDCFSENFSPSGYILGSDLNVSPQNTSKDFSDPFILMEQAAKCARVIYFTALKYDPYTVVILPFKAQEDVIEASAGSAAAEDVHSAITCSALADYYISRDPTSIRWASLVAADKSSKNDIPSQAPTTLGSGFLGTAITFPRGDEASLDSLKKDFPIALFYVSAASTGAVNAEQSVPKAETSLLPSMPEGFTGSAALWDFSGSYSIGNFVLSNLQSLETGACPVFTALNDGVVSRALYLDLTQRDEECPSVISVAPLSDGIDLQSSSAIEFRLAAFSASSTSELVLIIGSGKVRLRYPVTLESSKASSVVCRLPAGVVPTYFAICADAGDGVSVHLSSVNALSESLGNEELSKALFSTQEAAQSSAQTQDETPFALVIALISGVTLAAFIILNRYSRHRKKETTDRA